MDRHQPWKWIRSTEPDNPGDKAFEGPCGAVLGFSWPPKSYCCSFCGREFRSAQALGGHMNVHRRDRALLRNPNPNPNSLASSFSPCITSHPLAYRLPSLLSSSLTSFSSSSSSSEVMKIPALPASSLDPPRNARETDLSALKRPLELDPMVPSRPKSLFTVEGLRDFKNMRGSGLLPLFHGTSKNQNGGEFGDSGVLTRFELDIQTDSTNEDLDLELRLGYSSHVSKN